MKADDAWHAEEDARCLSEADVIKHNPKRYRKAIEAAKKMAEEKREQAQAMGKIARLVKPKTIKGK